MSADEKRAEATARFTAAIEDLRTSEGWQRWLAARKQLRKLIVRDMRLWGSRSGQEGGS